MAISALGSGGNLDQFMDELGAAQTWKGIGVAGATAGLTGGLGEVFGVAEKGLGSTALFAGVSAMGRIANGERDLGQLLGQTVVTAGATAASALCANTIGAAYKGGEMGFLTHKAFHGGLAAGLGAASAAFIGGSGAIFRAATSAAGATVAAETLAEGLQAGFGETWSRETYGTIATFAGAFTGWALGDANAGILASVNAIQNNYLSDDLNEAKETAEKISEDAFAEQGISEHVEVHGPISGAEFKKLDIKFRRFYHSLRQAHFARSIVNPGYERTEKLMGARDFEEFKEIRLAEIGLREGSTPERGHQTFESMQRHYDLIQHQKIEAALFAPVAALAMGGRGAVKLAPRAGGHSSLLKEVKVFDIRKSQGFDPTSLELLSKEQPWRVRAGQEYKAKIVGRSQATGTRGHKTEGYQNALELAKREDVARVYLNRGMNRVLRDLGIEEPGIKANTRADVTYVTKDGRVHQLEIRSKTDTRQALDARMRETLKQIPEEMQGGTDTIDIAAKHKPYE